MFFLRRQFFQQSKRLFTQSVTRFKFSEQHKDTEQHKNTEPIKEQPPKEQPKSSMASKIASVAVGMVAYTGYQIYQMDKTVKNDMPDVNVSVPDHISIAAEIYGKDSIQVAALLKEEAERLRSLDQIEQSVKLAKRALEIYNKEKPQSNEIAAIYELLSFDYLEQTKKHRHSKEPKRFKRLFDTGKKYMSQAGEIYIKNGDYSKGLDAMEVGAIVFSAINYKDGEKMLEEIAQLKKEKLGDNYPFAIKTIISQAMLYSYHNMDKERSQKLTEIVADMKKNKIAEENQCQVYHQLALIYFDKNEMKEGFDAIEKAINVMKTPEEQKKIDQLLSKNLKNNENDEKVAKICKKYVDKREKLNKAKVNTANNFRKKAEGQEKKQEYLQAIENWDKSVEGYQEAEKHEQAVYSKIKACLLYDRANKGDQVINCFYDAYQLAYRTFGDDHKMTAQSLEILNEHRLVNKKA